MKMNMGNMSDKLMNRFFRRVDGVVWDLFTGKIGVQTDDGITTIEGEGEDAQTVLNLMDQFGMAVPAFAQSTPIAAVAIGDLIYNNGKPKGWVVEVVRGPSVTVATSEDATLNEVTLGEVKRFKLMTPDGNNTTWTPPKISMLGLESGVMVLRSLMNMLPGGETGLNNMQGMIMPMMMMGGDMDMEAMMPMMLMSQLGADGTGANPLGGGNMMQTMMMMQMMGKNNSGKGGFFDQGQ